ncbi:MAG: hypothetical protein Tsb0020_00730 [Haliangiales bacterium]
MKLSNLLTALRQVAPESLAAPWDRVGLHVGEGRRRVRRALLCVDLTEPVMAEAVAAGCELIVAYHPPIFEPLKRLTEASWKERVIATAVRRRIAIYSPHTALDSVPGGIADWLCEGLGAAERRISVGGAAEVTLLGREPAGADQRDPALEPGLLGSGRVHYLARPVTAATLVKRIKQRLGCARLKVAAPLELDAAARGSRERGRIRSIFVCPGAGGSIASQAPAADAYLTGELQHHQALDLCARGRLVVLAGHTNTERPYLPVYREQLRAAGLDAVEWMISSADRAPFAIA